MDNLKDVIESMDEPDKESTKDAINRLSERVFQFAELNAILSQLLN